jgi:1,4-alpha-glucan branching enzyme
MNVDLYAVMVRNDRFFWRASRFCSAAFVGLALVFGSVAGGSWLTIGSVSAVESEILLTSGQTWQGGLRAGRWQHFSLDVLQSHSQLEVVFEVQRMSGDGGYSPFPERLPDPQEDRSKIDGELLVSFGETPNAGTVDYRLVGRESDGPAVLQVASDSLPGLSTGRVYLSLFANAEIFAELTVQLNALPSDRPGMGAKPNAEKSATSFRVWAPNADSVCVAGEFNQWNSLNLPLVPEDNGYWSFDVRDAFPGQEYRYVIRRGDQTLWRSDPYEEQIVNSVGNSIIFDDEFQWTDQAFTMPAWNELVIYEMHIGTMNDQPGGRPGNFASAIETLDYLVDLGINAVKVLPVSEFAGDFSWGYNPAYPFAVEEAYGGPREFKRFVNEAHRRGIAVILDVVYNHFGPSDLGLWRFDGWHQGDFGGIYFYQDSRSSTPWGDTRPDYGRGEVRQYIRDNVMMWLNEFRVDGIRWDAALYTRTHDDGDLPDGWALMQWINDEIDATQPWKISIAEDLQAEPWITRPTVQGGAGFDAQWTPSFVHPIRSAIVPPGDDDRNMFEVRDALQARYNADAFQRVHYTESHDEVANGRSRVPEEIWPGNAGSWWSRKRSTLGGALVMTAPGIPMIFQGQELLEDGYFQDTDPLDWSRLDTYAGIHLMYRDLIRLRRNWNNNTRGLRGQHINVFHVNNSDKVIAFHRWDQGGEGDDVIVVCNFRASDRDSNYRIGLPRPGVWQVRFNSDWTGYSPDFSNLWVPDVTAQAIPWDGMPYSGTLPIAAYSTLILSQDWSSSAPAANKSQGKRKSRHPEARKSPISR